MIDTTRTPLAMGDAFRDAGQVLARRGAVLLLLSAAFILTGGIVAAWLRLHPFIKGTGLSIVLANGTISWLIVAAPYSLFIGATAWTTIEVLEGRSPPLGDILGQSLRFFFPVLIVQTLYLLGTMAGAVFLAVPGLIVALMWILATQVVVAERLSVIEAFKRSRALTKGHRWALLGLLIAFGLVVLVLEWVIFQITSPKVSFIQAAAAPINAFGVVPLLSFLTTPLSIVVKTAIYRRLSQGHRGPADATAEVFA